MIPEEIFVDEIASRIYSNMRQMLPSKTDTFDQVLTGCKIIGAEVVDWPSAECVSLYLQDKDGRRSVLDISVKTSCKRPRLLVQRAEFPGRM